MVFGDGLSASPEIDIVDGEGAYTVDLTNLNDATWDKCNPSNGVGWTSTGEDDNCLNSLTVILAV